MSDRAVHPPLRATFNSLRQRNFRLYFFGQLVSQIGTWMQTTALAWFVLQRTHSAFALGAVSTFQFLPVLTLALFGGVIADRLPKQRLLIATQVTMTIQAVVLATLTATNLINLPLIYILVAIQGTANALDMPTRSAFLMEMVGPGEVPNAVALNSSQMQTTRLIGPSIAGILLATFGASVCFYCNAASFVAVLIALLLMDPKRFFKTERPKQAAMVRQLGEGLHYAVTTPDIFLAVITMAFIGTFGFNTQVTTPLIAQYVLHTNSVGYGLLTSTMALGSVAASLVMAWLAKPTRRLLLTSGACFSLVFLALGLSSTWYIALPLFLALGICSSLFTSTNTARLQLLAPSYLRGRVMSLSALLFAGSTPIGSLIIGTMAENTSVPPTITTMGGLCLLGVAVSLVYMRRVRGRLAGSWLELGAAGPVPDHVNPMAALAPEASQQEWRPPVETRGRGV
jgi:MFS family permease